MDASLKIEKLASRRYLRRRRQQSRRSSDQQEEGHDRNKTKGKLDTAQVYLDKVQISSEDILPLINQLNESCDRTGIRFVPEYDSRRIIGFIGLYSYDTDENILTLPVDTFRHLLGLELESHELIDLVSGSLMSIEI